MDANLVPKEVPETQSQFTMPLMLESKTKETPLDQDYEEDVIEDIVHEEDDNSLSLERKEKEMILKALRKHNNKRKYAANDLGISERTLYRKIKQYDIE
jgi:transcriptional regulator with PAS, ATPase and Fis domain